MWLWSVVARAQDVAPEVDVGGYVETYYQWNFNDPANGVTALRGFDNRHDTISLSNVALEVDGRAGDLSARIVLQAGLTPNTYTLAEPSYPPAQGVGETDRATWRNVQQAFGAWSATDRVLVEAGLFLSPIGPESLAVRDSWNWSRSDLFYGLPFYHTGARVTFQATEAVGLTAAVYNGWNAVVDNNEAKSLSARVGVASGDVSAAVLYFGGNERPVGAPEGTPWRNLFDAWAQWDATERFSLLLHGNVGVEPNELGAASWQAAALAARVQPIDPLYVAVRGDWFVEQVPDGGSAIFWPAEDGVGRVASATLTFDLRPVEFLSVRLEGRFDHAGTDAYFSDDPPADPYGGPLPDTDQQATATLGVVASF